VRRLFIVLFCFITLSGVAQDNKPRGYFLKDSVKIGETVPFIFSYSDRKNRPVIFPDSLFNFAPFELVDKAYFDTKSDSIVSIDSAVYYLSTFEIDSVQYLSLPVFVMLGEDSLAVYSSPDSIVLNQVVLQMPDSIKLIENAFYRPVDLQFNYPYWVVALIAVGLLVIIVLGVYGKQIRKKIQLYRLKKKLEKFNLSFDEEINSLNTDPTKEKIEQVLIFWKAYMERLEKIPYRKLTTKEIVALQQNSSLEETLKSIDRNIYSPIKVNALQNDFEFLKDYSLDRYNHVTQLIRNA